jgi:hypothetical protein
MASKYDADQSASPERPSASSPPSFQGPLPGSAPNRSASRSGAPIPQFGPQLAPQLDPQLEPNRQGSVNEQSSASIRKRPQPTSQRQPSLPQPNLQPNLPRPNPPQPNLPQPNAQSNPTPSNPTQPNAQPNVQPAGHRSVRTQSQRLGTQLETKRPQKASKRVRLAKVSESLSNIRWLQSWPMVMLVVFGIVGVAGTGAVVSLFRIPNLPNCRAIFWPTASAALRLQCAESYAAKGDVKSLLAAIALVDRLPVDHPLRKDIINGRIEDWASQVLDLAERSFEKGDLEEAIATAKKIPDRTAAAKLVEARIARWQKIWKEGEDAFNAAISELKAKNFQAAFSLSVKLLDVPNKFWATVKYSELTKLISQGREDSRKMSEALDFAKDGTVKGFTEALKRLNQIGKDSVFYSEAQGERKKIAKQMLAAAEDFLEAKELSEAQAMLAAIPRDTGITREIDDFQIFVTAYQQAWNGTVGGLENAISRMKTLGKNRPRYAKGQELIAQWQGELKNISLLNQARERAERGSTADLVAAIAIIQQVSRESPQWDDAAKQIGQWQTQVETVEDRPILERADRLAAVGTPDNLRAAIQEARKVGSERTLGQEADERIATWTGRIQRMEDQPILDQARQRAQTGDLAGAIALAGRIGEGRALYGAAQDAMAGWQSQESGRQRLDEAVNAASRGDAEALSNAIDIAMRVPAGSDSRSRADSQIDNWSWDLLAEAEAAANRNVETAISLAGRIPSQAEAYDSAQGRISDWQATLRQIEDSRRLSAPVFRAPEQNSSEVGENGVPNNLELAPPR